LEIMLDPSFRRGYAESHVGYARQDGNLFSRLLATLLGLLAEQVNVRLPIGQPALGHFEDLVRYRRGLIEDVEGGRGRGVLPGEGFGVLFFTRLRRAEPGCLIVAVVQAPGCADEPGRRQASLVPFLNGRPSLGFQLRVGVGW
jgi:hypothetical protein